MLTYNRFKKGKRFSEKTYSVTTTNDREIQITRGRELVSNNLVRYLLTAWAFTDLFNKLLIGLGTVTGATDLYDVVFTSFQKKKHLGNQKQDSQNYWQKNFKVYEWLC